MHLPKHLAAQVNHGCFKQASQQNTVPDAHIHCTLHKVKKDFDATVTTLLTHGVPARHCSHTLELMLPHQVYYCTCVMTLPTAQ